MNESNHKAEFNNVLRVMKDTIKTIKESNNRIQLEEIIDSYIYESENKDELLLEKELFLNIYQYYENYLKENNKVDFSDMIYIASKKMKNLKNKLDYKYIIIDEYQDISSRRYNFSKTLSEISNAKIVAVGDDWQTIYSFAGSRIELFMDFDRYFLNAQQNFINKTYRTPKIITRKASDFIMKTNINLSK